jgi:hypothetical protein
VLYCWRPFVLCCIVPAQALKNPPTLQLATIKDSMVYGTLFASSYKERI